MYNLVPSCRLHFVLPLPPPPSLSRSPPPPPPPISLHHPAPRRFALELVPLQVLASGAVLASRRGAGGWSRSRSGSTPVQPQVAEDEGGEKAQAIRLDVAAAEGRWLHGVLEGEPGSSVRVTAAAGGGGLLYFGARCTFLTALSLFARRG
jgi:hypothetical protein